MGVLEGPLQETLYNPNHDSKLTTEYDNPAPETGPYYPLVKLSMHVRNSGIRTVKFTNRVSCYFLTLTTLQGSKATFTIALLCTQWAVLPLMLFPSTFIILRFIV